MFTRYVKIDSSYLNNCIQVRLKNKEGRKASEVAATEEIKNILEWEEKELEGGKFMMSLRSL